MDLSPLWLSLWVAALSTALSLVLGVAIGALLSRRAFPGRDVLDAAVALPLVLPPTVLGYYLLVVLGRDSAVGRAWEAAFGAPLVFSPAAAVVAAMVHGVPLLAKAARAALEDVDPQLLRAAASLGAGGLRALWTVALPLSRPVLGAAALLALARALGDFGVTLMLAGDIPGRTQTAALAIYDAVQGGRDRDALVLSGLLSVVAAVVLYGTGKLTRRVPAP